MSALPPPEERKPHPSAHERVAPVSAFICLECNGVHATRERAAICCTCAKCGRKFPGMRGAYSIECERCSYRSQLAYARASLRRAEGQVEEYRENVERILARKKAGFPDDSEDPEGGAR